MTNREAEKEWLKLTNEIQDLNILLDDYDFKIGQLKDDIKEETKELQRLTKSIQNKTQGIQSLQTKISLIPSSIKEKEKRQEYLENNFDF